MPAEQLDRVIRRAAELQAREARAGDAAREALAESEIVSIGREVGLEPRHVRRALAELRARSLAPGPVEEEGLARSLLGPAFARARRIVPGEPRQVQRRLEAHFRENESLEPIRERERRSLWEPAGGLLNQMRRSLDVGGRGYELAEARAVELAVVGVDPGDEVESAGPGDEVASADRGGDPGGRASMVTLTADLRNLRSQQLWTWAGVGGGMGSALGVVLVAAAGLPALAVGSVLLAGTAGATAGGVRWTLERKRRRTRLVIEGLLDRLERGEDLSGRTGRSSGRWVDTLRNLEPPAAASGRKESGREEIRSEELGREEADT